MLYNIVLSCVTYLIIHKAQYVHVQGATVIYPGYFFVPGFASQAAGSPNL